MADMPAMRGGNRMDEMTGCERLARRMKGEPVDRPPNFNIFMSYAAHHIGRTLSDYYQDYRVLCEANLAVLRDFSLDIVNTMSDAYRETADWGAEIEFPPDSLPMSKAPLLRELTDIRSLHSPDALAGRRMSDRLRAVGYYHQHVGGQVPIMGWVEGALAETADLRGVSTLMTDLYDDPEGVEAVLERCTAVAIDFARVQIEAGADIIGLGDAVASQVSPRMYRRFALPYEQRIFAAVHDMGALSRLHICGNISKLLPDIAHCGADIVDVDWMVDFQEAARTCGTQTVCGNFDPVGVLLQGSPDSVRAAVQHSVLAGGPRCISMAGCEIPDGTPQENLLAHVEALRALGSLPS
jgi:MtaA/CmuA family methyltransferase